MIRLRWIAIIKTFASGDSARTRTMLAMLGVLGLAIAALLAIFAFGGVSGTEFCPQTFSTRTFTFCEFPGIGAQLTGVRRTALVNDVEGWIALNAPLPVDNSSPRWDLIDGHRGSSTMAPSGAEILHRYVTATDNDGSSVWERWSRDHSAEAKRFWPIVARLARMNLYPLMPDAFAGARAFDATTSLEAALAARMGPALHERAKWAKDHGDQEAARAMWDLALELDPAREEWKQARATLSP